MSKKYFFMILAFIVFQSFCFAETRAITSDGQKVLLKEDGTWISVFSNKRNSEWLRTDDTARVKKEIKKTDLNLISLESFSGPAYYKNKEGDWQEISKDSTLAVPMSFKTGIKGILGLQIANDNCLKLYPETEITILKPETSNRNIQKQIFKLSYGEVNAKISMDGRSILQAKFGEIEVLFESGLSKLIIDKDLNGEVVVKNGLIAIQLENNMRKKTKVSGFYKSEFKNNRISPPRQASVIQYDWR